jgi:hypothetical protein
MNLVTWEGGAGWRGQAVPECRHFEFASLPWIHLRRAGMTNGAITCIKISRSRHVLKLDRPREHQADLDEPVFVKRYLIATARRRLGNLLSGGKARREFRLGWRLLEGGFRTPQPLAYAIAGPGRIIEPLAPPHYASAASFLLTRGEPNQGPLREWLQAAGAAEAGHVLQCLARFLAAMHARGFYHDDCSAKNIAPAPDFDRALSEGRLLDLFVIFDIDHGRLLRRPVPWHGRAHNLFQMIRSLRESVLADPDRRRWFVKLYLEAANFKNAHKMEKLFARRINRLTRRKVGQPLLE